MIKVDNDIIEKCKAGDRAAFRSLVLAYQPMLYSLSLKMLCCDEDAKDALQDTFIKVWQNIASYEGRCSFSTWIYTIASRICIDRLRSARPFMPLAGDEETLRDYVNDADPHRALESSEWVRIARLLAGKLSAKQRLVFTLCHFEGLEVAEVEQITGMSADKVKKNLYVARQTIRERLKQLGYE